jgi:hypothetical protein
MVALVVGLQLIAQVLGADGSGSGDETPLAPPPVVEQVADATPTPAVDYAPGLPIGGAFGQRLYCIEGHESNHGLHMYNPSSGARGYLQWLPGTARAWGVLIGNRNSEWSGAARIADQGEAFFRSQWPVTARLCP